MKKTLKIIKWTAITVVAAFVVASAYVGMNSFDSEPPDVSRFVNPMEVPSDADNVYCALVAATNVVNENVGKLVLDSVFENYKDAFERYSQHKGMTTEERDLILAEAAKPLALFHEAAQRKTWYAFDKSTGKRQFFPAITRLMQLCRLAELEAMRHIARGETGAAVENVRDMLLLARKIENDSESAVRWLVVNGCLLRYADNIAMKLVQSGKATDEDLVRLQDALRQFELPNRHERAQRMLNNDFTVFFGQMMEQVDTSEISTFLKNRDNSTTLDAWVARIVPLIRPYAFHRNRSWTIYANLLDKMKERFRLGYDKAEWEKLEEEARVACGATTGWRFGPNFAGKKMIEVTMPEWQGIAISIAKSSFQHAAAETVVAAARFRRKTGAYPKTLAELVPEFLPAVPEDPFAYGKELKYDATRGVIWTTGKDSKKNRNYEFNINGR